jgi:CHASE2 domain-containing sensor protein
MHFMDHWKGLIQNPMYGIAILILFACLLVLFIYRWKQKPAVINLGLVSGIVLFVLFLIGGMPMEFRIFYDVMAAVIISVMHSLLMRWNCPPRLNSMSTEEFLGSIRSWIAENKVNSTGRPAPSS